MMSLRVLKRPDTSCSKPRPDEEGIETSRLSSSDWQSRIQCSKPRPDEEGIETCFWGKVPYSPL